MLESGATEIAELVRRLGSRNAVTADVARGRLAVVGGHAVDALIAALEGDSDVRRARVMPLIALIQDRRGVAPLVAMLRDRNPRLREIAARSLARFPDDEVACALGRVMRADRSPRARVAAVQSLLEHHAAGLDRAMAPLLDVLTDGDAGRAIRLAALPLLERVGPGVRRGLAERLDRDDDPALRRALGGGVPCGDDGAACPDRLSRTIARLASPDWTTWNGAIAHLTSLGGAIVAPLVDEMIARAHDPEFCARAGMALRGLGRRHAAAIVDELPRIEDPLPRLMLVDAVGAIGVKAAIYRLRDVAIDDVARERDDGLDLHRRVRARAHLHLARTGSRVAAAELRRMLDDPRARVEPELLEALDRIGTREEIGPLLAAWDREDDGGRRAIAAVVRTIMRRERIRRNSRCIRELGSSERRVLLRILPAPRRASRRGAARPAAGRTD